MNPQELDDIVADHDLNRHPFYRSWRAGELSRSTIAVYAAEYAPFIDSIEIGWSALGDLDHAAEERQHAALWGRFREALGSGGEPRCEEAAALARCAIDAFGDRSEALGALYAFEAQQPATAARKLEGLMDHYGFSDHQAAYFRIHASDYGERDRLAAHAAQLSPDDSARARDACERTCRAMWSALDGILRDGVAAPTGS